jgi:translation initiation factor 3 subunit A
MQHVAPELKDLYAFLEDQFHPLQLCTKVQPILAFVAAAEPFAHYVKPLQHSIMMRLFKQVRVYNTMHCWVWGNALS